MSRETGPSRRGPRSRGTRRARRPRRAGPAGGAAASERAAGSGGKALHPGADRLRRAPPSDAALDLRLCAARRNVSASPAAAERSISSIRAGVSRWKMARSEARKPSSPGVSSVLSASSGPGCQDGEAGRRALAPRAPGRPRRPPPAPRSSPASRGSRSCRRPAPLGVSGHRARGQRDDPGALLGGGGRGSASSPPGRPSRASGRPSGRRRRRSPRAASRASRPVVATSARYPIRAR